MPDDAVYIDAAARHATPEHKKALLLNALAVKGLNTYMRAAEDEPGADQPTQATTCTNLYDAALARLNEIFDPQADLACLRAHFRALRQGPDQLVVEFIQEVRRTAKLCEFGVAGDILAFDQIVAAPQKNCFEDGQKLHTTGGARRSERGRARLPRVATVIESASRRSVVASDSRWGTSLPSD
ncbi:hypothetical protein HPB51_023514 [Rhipicephalus microplus]|uniref:Uncharacterized protein n=1 Tax=Rhipicephalus microplus TaxID=6941 RepID=A0A9J6EK22_RHIMP|nr:hypothetical protein HPB51_023514 [Rhipicephalus microplus]